MLSTGELDAMTKSMECDTIQHISDWAHWAGGIIVQNCNRMRGRRCCRAVRAADSLLLVLQSWPSECSKAALGLGLADLGPACLLPCRLQG